MSTTAAHNVRQAEPARVKANGIEIAYDTFGDQAAPPMLLIQGLGMQMIMWDEDFCKALAARGFWVIRFDNRDVGLSTHMDEAGIPDLRAVVQAQMLGQPVPSSYTLDDMAEDAIGLLDALNVKSAHVVGISMGGMIAQTLAIRHPDRVRTLTSIMSATGRGGAPRPKPEAQWILVTPAPTERAAYVEHSLQLWRTLNGPAFPLDEEHVRVRAEQGFERGVNPAGTTRQLVAIMASGSRAEALKTLTLPTVVIHGDADPLIPVEHGIETAETIPGAERMIIPGMGHNLPPAATPQVVDAIARHVRGRETTA